MIDGSPPGLPRNGGNRSEGEEPAGDKVEYRGIGGLAGKEERREEESGGC